MVFTFVTVAILASIVVTDGTVSSSQNQPRSIARIVGGQNVTINEVPHQASIQVEGFHHCGGTIISKEWVLTAAHCCSYPMKTYSIRVGTHRLQTGGSVRRVAKIIIHEDYSTTYMGVQVNDVCLIRVKEPFEFDATCQTIPFLRRKTTVGELSTISGWGVTNNGQLSQQLQILNLPIVSRENCSKAYKKYGGIREGQICAGYPEGGKDACNSDSGGPMTINGYLAGIVSWGEGCALPGFPGVYSEIIFYLRWILSHTDM